jgi:nicotinamide-nucleotide amidase
MLSVKLEQLDQYGAVSEEVARSMAEGALGSSKADIAIACTGVAGPSGATDTKPVGLVHLSCASRQHPTLHKKCNFSGERSTIRLATVDAAFGLIEAQLNLI